MIGCLRCVLGCSDDERESQCAAFHACGGEVEGTWRVGNSCIEGNLKAAATLNPELPVACQGMYRSVIAAMSGSVTFVGGKAQIDTMLEISADISADADCVSALGMTGMDQCSELGTGLSNASLHDSATCDLDGNRCNCQATSIFEETKDREYTVEGSKITYSGDDEYLDYCITGNTLHARQFRNDLVATVFIDAERQ